MIAFHFPERTKTENTMQPRERDHSSSFIIQVGDHQQFHHHHQFDHHHHQPPKLNLSAMKLFNRFRKIIMRLLFSIPSRSATASSSSSSGATSSTPRQRNSTSCDRFFEPPKTSCSSYYSSHSHYNEAIADCIEFFNKSSSSTQEDMLDFDPQSSVMV
ncbi:uncharacterized protein LOC18793073 [Prunus persica]|nr:uncharacterized protein LOC18793073 [Prunus persica]